MHKCWLLYICVCLYILCIPKLKYDDTMLLIGNSEVSAMLSFSWRKKDIGGRLPCEIFTNANKFAFISTSNKNDKNSCWQLRFVRNFNKYHAYFFHFFFIRLNWRPPRIYTYTSTLSPKSTPYTFVYVYTIFWWWEMRVEILSTLTNINNTISLSWMPHACLWYAIQFIYVYVCIWMDCFMMCISNFLSPGNGEQRAVTYYSIHIDCTNTVYSTVQTPGYEYHHCYICMCCVL